MRTLQVDLGERSYPIIIGSHLLGQGDLLRPYIAGRQVAIVTNRKDWSPWILKWKETSGKPVINLLIF